MATPSTQLQTRLSMRGGIFLEIFKQCFFPYVVATSAAVLIF